MINDLGLKNFVNLLGALPGDEVVKHLLASDIFLLPSLYEGINSALEAMAVGIPIISTSAGGMEEAIEHNKNGLIAELYNSYDMANKVKELVNDKVLRDKLVKLGLKK